MPEALRALREHLAYVSDLSGLATLAAWDMQVNMPRAAATSRADQLAAVRRAIRTAFLSEDTTRLLAYAEAENAPDAALEPLLRVTRSDLSHARKLPHDFIAEQTRAAALAESAWREAKAASDFRVMRPHLEKRFELARRAADLTGWQDHPYDALLGNYEPGMRTRDLLGVFEGLRAQIVPLVREVAARDSGADEGLLRRGYEEGRLRDFALEVAGAIGYDLTRGRQDPAPHPFCSGVSPDDARITTRLRADDLSSLLSAWHEAGHGMHHQGVDPAYRRTPLMYGSSTGPRPLGLGESQSKIWDGPVARSRGFWVHFLPRLQALFPQQLEGVTAEDVYRALNVVRPGLIRVSADQLTYDLHIMLRTELEIALVEERLSVNDLPDAWNEKMREYLGVTPPDDAHGVLQDPHWTDSVGYFPTYTLGNIMSVQFYGAAQRDLGDLDAMFARGEFAPLREWLREHVHRHGRALPSQELLRRTTGGGLDAGPYVNYLRGKFGELYGLKDEATPVR